MDELENLEVSQPETPKETPRWLQIVFPDSIARQLQATFIALGLVIAGSVAGALTEVWNLNLLAPLVVGVFFSKRIHPVFAAGPAAIALAIMGIWWIVALATGMSAQKETSLAITGGGFNVFLLMTAGSLIALAYGKLTQKPAAQ